MGGLAAAGALVAVLAHRRDELSSALEAAPIVLLALAALLQLAALVARTEAWHRCVGAAGGTIARRPLYRAAGLGYLASQVNCHLAAAARIAALRRAAPEASPRVPALIAAEIPILGIEAVLAALASFTVVGALGLPWWLGLLAVAAALLVMAGLRRLARGRTRGFWSGLAVLRRSRERGWVLGLVLVAVFAQIARNWLMLHAVGVDASLIDATAVLIAIVVLAQLPVGPSVGPAAVVVILGADGIAATAAAGMLLTATGTAGALAYVAWAGADSVLARRRPKPARDPAVQVPAAVRRAAHVPAAVRPAVHVPAALRPTQAPAARRRQPAPAPALAERLAVAAAAPDRS